jgi:hypothetical protein
MAFGFFEICFLKEEQQRMSKMKDWWRGQLRGAELSRMPGVRWRRSFNSQQEGKTR